jgi:hypothetical protein
LAKYECTVRHLGNPSGSIRHWQALLSRYNTPLNISYKSTVRGLVPFRTPSIPTMGVEAQIAPRSHRLDIAFSFPYSFVTLLLLPRIYTT